MDSCLTLLESIEGGQQMGGQQMGGQRMATQQPSGGRTRDNRRPADG